MERGNINLKARSTGRDSRNSLADAHQAIVREAKLRLEEIVQQVPETIPLSVKRSARCTPRPSSACEYNTFVDGHLGMNSTHYNKGRAKSHGEQLAGSTSKSSSDTLQPSRQQPWMSGPTSLSQLKRLRCGDWNRLYHVG